MNPGKGAFPDHWTDSDFSGMRWRPSTPLLITVDGPAGAGKTTVSRRLANILGYRYVDTGALYRGVALAALEAGIPPDDDAELAALCAGLELKFEENLDGTRLLINGRDITDALRTPEIAMTASTASARPSVRTYLLALQRHMGKDRCAVFEGRDMGTVVFPDADVKFFLDADPHTRAVRRFKEMRHPESMTLEEMEAEIRKRDEADTRRSLAPLKPASDAVHIDSSGLTEGQVVRCMLEHIQTKAGA